MSHIFNVGWQNANSQRAYPLTTWASRTDSTGQLVLPNAFILGLKLSIDAGAVINPTRFFISAVDVTPPLGFTIDISYLHTDDSVLPVATAVIPSTHTEGDTYFLQGVGDFSAAVGSITIGDITEMNTAAPGTYSFTYEAGTIELDAITPLTSGVSSITVVNGLERSAKLTGDIELFAGNNQRITPSLVDAETTRITFSAINSAGLNQDCGCAEDLGDPIRSINGVFSDSSRNLQIINGPCIEIEQVSNGLRIKNTCATPCCSCKELDKIQENLNRFADGVATLNGFAVTLGGEVRQLTANVLTSHLVGTPPA